MNDEWNEFMGGWRELEAETGDASSLNQYEEDDQYEEASFGSFPA